eukprot:COSAG01_NODE_9741_length_2357_cov_3.922055_3_plen_136_part_00
MKQLIAACEAQFVQRQQLARVVHLVPLFQRLTEKETDMVRARSRARVGGGGCLGVAPHTLCALRARGARAATSRCPGPGGARTHAQVASTLELLQVAPGDAVIREGEAGHDMYQLRTISMATETHPGLAEIYLRF